MVDTEPLVRIRDLRYRYPGADHDVLRIPFLDVSGTGLIAVTGPSGAGKSTLIEILAGTLRGDYSGSVHVLGREWSDLHRDAERQRHLRRIGFIPQDYGLLTDRSVADVLRQDLRDCGVDPTEHPQRIEIALHEAALGGFEDRQVAALSGGQRQRVAIARMLARDVELVIADEPTANLDPALTKETLALFRDLAARSPVLVITHDPTVASACDRTIVLQSAVADAEPSSSTSPTRPSKHRKRTSWIAAIAVLAIVGAALAIVTAGRGKQSGTHAKDISASAPTTAHTQSPAHTQRTSPPTTGISPTTSIRPQSTSPTTTAVSSTTTRPVGTTVNTSPNDTGQLEGSLPLPAGSPPAPDLASLLSPNVHVVSEKWVRLDGTTPQVLVTDTELSAQSPNGTATDLVLFAWDSFANRWESVFDAAKGSGPNEPVLPTDEAVFGLTYTTITPTPGRTDLVFGAGLARADSTDITDILHYDGQTASIVYSGGIGSYTVTGTAPHQQLSMTGGWVDPADAACCPVRSYSQTVGWNPNPEAPGTNVPTGYQVLSDTRSWLGVYVATRIDTDTSTGASSTSTPVVMTVVPNSPAAGILEPGDQLLSVQGIPQPSNPPPPPAPAIIDQIDSQQPGTVVALSIRRGSQQLTEDITLSSYANPAEGQAVPPTPGYLGVVSATGSDGDTPGAYVQSVVPGSAASQAGLQEGDLITSLGGFSVATEQDLTSALLGTAAWTATPIEYIDNTGAIRTVTVTLAAWPSSSTDSSDPEPSVWEI